MSEYLLRHCRATIDPVYKHANLMHMQKLSRTTSSSPSSSGASDVVLASDPTPPPSIGVKIGLTTAAMTDDDDNVAAKSINSNEQDSIPPLVVDETKWECHYCHSRTTTLKRHGPQEYRDLCNSCAAKWSRGKILPQYPKALYPPNRSPFYGRGRRRSSAVSATSTDTPINSIHSHSSSTSKRPPDVSVTQLKDERPKRRSMGYVVHIDLKVSQCGANNTKLAPQVL